MSFRLSSTLRRPKTLIKMETFENGFKSEEFWEPDASFSKRSSLGVDMKKRSPMKKMTFKNGDGDLIISMRL